MGKVVTSSAGGKWWAENGLIRCVTSGGEYQAMMPSVLEERLKTMQELTTKQAAQGHITFEEARIQRGWIKDLGDLIRDARIQGTPEDDSAVRDAVRRLPKSVHVNRE